MPLGDGYWGTTAYSPTFGSWGGGYGTGGYDWGGYDWGGYDFGADNYNFSPGQFNTGGFITNYDFGGYDWGGYDFGGVNSPYFTPGQIDTGGLTNYNFGTTESVTVPGYAGDYGGDGYAGGVEEVTVPGYVTPPLSAPAISPSFTPGEIYAPFPNISPAQTTPAAAPYTGEVESVTVEAQPAAYQVHESFSPAFFSPQFNAGDFGGATTPPPITTPPPTTPPPVTTPPPPVTTPPPPPDDLPVEEVTVQASRPVPHYAVQTPTFSPGFGSPAITPGMFPLPYLPPWAQPRPRPAPSPQEQKKKSGGGSPGGGLPPPKMPQPPKPQQQQQPTGAQLAAAIADALKNAATMLQNNNGLSPTDAAKQAQQVAETIAARNPGITPLQAAQLAGLTPAQLQALANDPTLTPAQRQAVLDALNIATKNALANSRSQAAKRLLTGGGGGGGAAPQAPHAATGAAAVSPFQKSALVLPLVLAAGVATAWGVTHHKQVATTARATARRVRRVFN